jgi:nucleoside-diphosphate-sugar epimerase
LAGRTKAHRLEDYLPVNEQGVLNVVRACADQSSPPAVLVVSSLSAAGAMPGEKLRTEGDPVNPVSHYGRSKRAGELVAEAWAGKLPITVIRPPIVFGPGDSVTRGLFRSISNMNRHFVLGLGRRVSVVYVENLVAAMIAAAERGERLPAGGNGAGTYSPGKGYYFVAEDEHPTYVDFGRMIGRAVGRPNVRVVRVPYFMMWASAAFGETVARLSRRSPYLGFDRAREITAGHWICSPEKARTQLGFAPTTPLEDHFRQTADWYASEGWL